MPQSNTTIMSPYKTPVGQVSNNVDAGFSPSKMNESKTLAVPILHGPKSISIMSHRRQVFLMGLERRTSSDALENVATYSVK